MVGVMLGVAVLEGLGVSEGIVVQSIPFIIILPSAPTKTAQYVPP